MGLQFDVAKDGELYMMSQGTGGGYGGDPLERAPEDVVADLEIDRISGKVAHDIYGVVYEPQTFVVDIAATDELRASMRRARIARGVPYAQFVEQFVTPPEPPKDLLYYGAWGDTEELTATHFTVHGAQRVTTTIDKMPIIMMPDRREVKISELTRG